VNFPGEMNQSPLPVFYLIPASVSRLKLSFGEISSSFQIPSIFSSSSLPFFSFFPFFFAFFPLSANYILFFSLKYDKLGRMFTVNESKFECWSLIHDIFFTVRHYPIFTIRFQTQNMLFI